MLLPPTRGSSCWSGIHCTWKRKCQRRREEKIRGSPAVLPRRLLCACCDVNDFTDNKAGVRCYDGLYTSTVDECNTVDSSVDTGAGATVDSLVDTQV